MTHYSRSDWGARPARSGPGPLDPSDVEGIAFHWPAMSSPIGTVDGVKAALRGWQDFHMDGRGWSDIAYQVAVDQDGNRYELRGLATQSGANGDTDVNERFGAVLLILAPGEALSDAMVAESRAVVADHRDLFPGSTRIVTHNDIRPEPTACPGPAATEAVHAGRFDPEGDDMPITDADAQKIAEAVRKELHGGEQSRFQRLRDTLRNVNGNLRDLETAVADDATRAQVRRIRQALAAAESETETDAPRD